MNAEYYVWIGSTCDNKFDSFPEAVRVADEFAEDGLYARVVDSNGDVVFSSDPVLIELPTLMEVAADLCDGLEDGSNPEYLRAICELLARATPRSGVMTEDRAYHIKRLIFSAV